MQVLIAEDDAAAARLLNQAVREAGYQAQIASDGESAWWLASSVEFDLLLLDVMLPGRDGLTLSRQLRAAKVTTPILLLTARDTLEDIVAGLDAGADDYLIKPFRLAELLARMRALLRRGVSGPSVLSVGSLTLDPATRSVTRDGESLTLSATEYRLLEYFMRNAGRVLTRTQLLEHVWGYDFEGTEGVLDVYLSYLRTKIDRGRDKTLLHTLRGQGYSLRL